MGLRGVTETVRFETLHLRASDEVTLLDSRGLFTPARLRVGFTTVSSLSKIQSSSSMMTPMSSGEAKAKDPSGSIVACP